MLPQHDQALAFANIQSNTPVSPLDAHQYRHQTELDDIDASKSRKCLKKITRFLFSHIGLVGLVVVYAVAGGFLFELLEEHQEKVNCQELQGEQMTQITKLKQKLVAYIQYNTSSSPTTSSSLNQKDNTTVAFEKIGQILYDYRDFVIQTSSKYRSYGEDCSVTNKWTYPNALLFSITIISTIGYGNITPVTWEGQLCCICYATIGIPIFLLCLANISGVLGQMFRFIYAKVICRPCYMLHERRRLAKRMKLKTENSTPTEQTRNNGWSTADPDEPRKESIKRTDKPLNAESTDMDEKLMPNERVAVPLTVTMIIIAGYIWIGSALFHSFEGWSMTQAGYFCFITLATIGFGDFVPGQRRDDPNAGAKLILGAIYVLFGMAILAMCFDLMQEEIVAKFRWLGRKVGIVDKMDDKDDEPSINQGEKTSSSNKKLNSSSSSLNHLNPSGTTTAPDNVNDFREDRLSSSPRKSSPKTNIARIHPLTLEISNSETLHQRVISNKGT